MRIIETRIEDVKIIVPKAFADSRGYFFESFQKDRYGKFGMHFEFVQDNFSHSIRGVLRGLHYQLKFPQGKLVTVFSGEVFDVAVDIRKGSPTFGKWVGVILSEENHYQLYIPPGFAHGFCVMSEHAGFHYKCTDYYKNGDERGVLWNDPTIGIDWPVSKDFPRILSKKDAEYSELARISDTMLPIYKK